MPTKNPKLLVTMRPSDIEALTRLQKATGLKSKSAVIRSLIRNAQSKIT